MSDAEGSSIADSVTINVSALNTLPLSNAGADQVGEIGDVITLDGSASVDVDGDNLTYSWTLTSVPTGSAAVLSASNIVMPTFTADIAGVYEAELIVNDGQIDSNNDVVTVGIEHLNAKPVANAGPDQVASINDLITLDGSTSSDVDGDLLTWHWSLISKPTGSNAQLTDDAAVGPTFTADLDGQYVAQLVVKDIESDSDPDSVIINTGGVNTIPVANASPDQSVSVGSLVTLEGIASSDANGDSLTYYWSLVSVPATSSSSLDNPLITNPAFTPDVPGNYVVQLIVNDGQASSEPDITVISTSNSRPVAEAGGSQAATIGDIFQLNASA